MNQVKPCLSTTELRWRVAKHRWHFNIDGIDVRLNVYTIRSDDKSIRLLYRAKFNKEQSWSLVLDIVRICAVRVFQDIHEIYPVSKKFTTLRYRRANLARNWCTYHLPELLPV